MAEGQADLFAIESSKDVFEAAARVVTSAAARNASGSREGQRRGDLWLGGRCKCCCDVACR